MKLLATSTAMPMHWAVDSKERLFTIVAEGDVTRADFDACLDTMDRAKLYGYRKLFDGARADTRMGQDDILAIGVRMRVAHAKEHMGPLAIVVPRDKTELIARVLGMLAAAKRPMRVFDEVGPARAWLLKQPH